MKIRKTKVYFEEIFCSIGLVTVALIFGGVAISQCDVMSKPAPEQVQQQVEKPARQPARQPSAQAETAEEASAVVVSLAGAQELEFPTPVFGSSLEHYEVPELTFGLEGLVIAEFDEDLSELIESTNVQIAVTQAVDVVESELVAIETNSATSQSVERIGAAQENADGRVQAIQNLRIDRAALVASERIHAATSIASTRTQVILSTVELCSPLLSTASGGNNINLACPDLPEIPEFECPLCPETRAVSLLQIEHVALTAEREALCLERIEASIATRRTIFDRILQPWFVIAMIIGAAVILSISLLLSGKNQNP